MMTPSPKTHQTTMIETLQEKLAELLQVRDELEARERRARSKSKKRELLQGIIDLTHQIQALRVVIELFSEKDE